MLKRTKGRILLTLLVVTGFAGTVNNTAPTKEERKLAIEHLKDTKAELQKSIKGLSQAQLNFKASPEDRSIRECFFHLAISESESWKILETTMQGPPRPEKRKDLLFSDKELLNIMAAGTGEDICIQSPETKWKNLAVAQAAFKQARMQHVKYIKTTTEDLRNHIIRLPVGAIDCYQFILFISAHSDRHLREIQDIMSHPAFPQSDARN